MQVFEDKGICVRQESSFYIDASKRAVDAAISHSHSDHVRIYKDSKYLVTQGTYALIEDKIREKKNFKIAKFGKKTKIGEFEVSLHNAGHILGSAQVLVEGNKSVAVTSDFKLQKSLLFEPAEILHSDVLVMESTFGLSHFNFPPREQVYEDMIKWMHGEIERGRFIVLAGYATGKSQELTAIVNEFMNTTPLVHERIYENNKIYETQGVKLGEYIKLNHNLNESNVLIMPPSLINSALLQALQFSLKRKVSSALASGWQFNGCFNKTFPLSDHADFQQLMQYVKEANPKMVLTTHGYAKEFANHVQRRLKIPAHELRERDQKSLAEFSN